MTDNKKNLVITMNEDLHLKFKIYCTKKRKSMKDMIIDLISRELDEVQERKP